ncbi:MAG TPA: DUF4835 family protein [Flavobacteriia bacterium]|nr:DUF4835 family protein [Flavobacteriia bacterium]
MQKVFTILLIFYLSVSFSQELNCVVTVNHDQVRSSNNQVFNTMEKAISDYLNKTQFTNKKYKKQEKVKCALTINITEQPDNDKFKGSLQLQVLRPVYHSTYESPILNHVDKDISFQYEEFQPLIYNKTSFESNLTSILTFYAYLILGFDDDSFALYGGTENFKKAQEVMLVAQQGGYIGWKNIDGNTTRFILIDNLLNNTFRTFRLVMYNYHRKGLDTMYKNKINAKKQIANAIVRLKQIYTIRPNAYLLRIFVDTKQDEIVAIFKKGPRIDTTNLVETLMKMYPSKSDFWKDIK